MKLLEHINIFIDIDKKINMLYEIYFGVILMHLSNFCNLIFLINNTYKTNRYTLLFVFFVGSGKVWKWKEEDLTENNFSTNFKMGFVIVILLQIQVLSDILFVHLSKGKYFCCLKS